MLLEMAVQDQDTNGLQLLYIVSLLKIADHTAELTEKIMWGLPIYFNEKWGTLIHQQILFKSFHLHVWRN